MWLSELIKEPGYLNIVSDYEQDDRAIELRSLAEEKGFFL
jgi:hypothetical protein